MTWPSTLGSSFGFGSVTLKFQDGVNEETIQRTLPLVVRDLDVDFYPEGGDLILGATPCLKQMTDAYLPGAAMTCPLWSSFFSTPRRRMPTLSPAWP